TGAGRSMLPLPGLVPRELAMTLTPSRFTSLPSKRIYHGEPPDHSAKPPVSRRLSESSNLFHVFGFRFGNVPVKTELPTPVNGVSAPGPEPKRCRNSRSYTRNFQFRYSVPGTSKYLSSEP